MSTKEKKISILKNKPDVIYIGYPRAGSTFLRSYFSNHPDIHWTRTPEYFGSNEKFYSEECLYYGPGADKKKAKCIIDMYECHVLGYIWSDHKLGELKDKVSYIKREINSPFNRDYYYPDPGEIASRIKITLPKAKVLIVLRNQVDWIRSYYIYHLNVLPGKNKTLYDFLSTRFGKCVLFSGLYHNTIEPYNKLFGKENVYVMLLEQIKDDSNDALKRLSQFLGVDFVELPKKKERLNKGFGDRFARGVKRLSKLGIGINKNNVKRLRWLIRLSGRINVGENDILTMEEKAFIRSFYAASNFHTSQLLGIDLDAYGYPV